MEGREPAGMYSVFYDCSDPAREREFDDWCEKVHMPDALSTGHFTHGLRLSRSGGFQWDAPTQWRPSQPAEGMPLSASRYLETYEAAGDIIETVASFRSAMRSKNAPLSPYLARVRTFCLRRISERLSPYASVAQPPTRGLLLVAVSVPEPARVQEFHQSQRLHVQHVFQCNVREVVAATRYENAAYSGAPGEPQFFTFYEYATVPDEPLGRVQAAMRQRLLEGTTPSFDYAQFLGVQTYRRTI